MQAGTVTGPTRKELLHDPAQVAALVAEGRLQPADVPDPHNQPDACIACHMQTPTGRSLYLRQKDHDALCNTCHAVVSQHSYIHPSGVTMPLEMRRRAPTEFRKAMKRSGNRLTCTVCHDLPKQCKPAAGRVRVQEPLFLRGGPWGSRTDLCYVCHDRNSYQRLNPHDQVDDEGRMRKETCRICHRSTEGLEQAMTIDEVDFNYKGDLAQMCLGCHPWTPHPGGTFAFGINNHEEINHLVVPPADMRRYIEAGAEQRAFDLPMEPGTGKVFCGTCHNPHERGVIRNPRAATGAGSENRLRDQDLCRQCHDK